MSFPDKFDAVLIISKAASLASIKAYFHSSVPRLHSSNLSIALS
jgi:hypothetical protein